MSKLHFLPLLLAITSICLSSCEGNNSGTSTTTTGDATFILDPEEGGSQMLALEFANTWEVTESPSWCTVSPASGEAGQVEMTVSASSANENLMEREGTFKIRLASSEEVEYWVVQRGTEGISVLRQDAYALDTGEDVTFRIEGNVPVTAESISTDAEWLTVKSVETSDSVLLGDGRTNSEYYTGEIVLSVENNTDAGQNSGAVFLVCNYAVLQQQDGDTVILLVFHGHECVHVYSPVGFGDGREGHDVGLGREVTHCLLCQQGHHLGRGGDDILIAYLGDAVDYRDGV